MPVNGFFMIWERIAAVEEANNILIFAFVQFVGSERIYTVRS